MKRSRFKEEQMFTRMAEARHIIEAWRVDYNECRPHSSLGERSPAEFAAQAATRPKNNTPPNKHLSPGSLTITVPISGGRSAAVENCAMADFMLKHQARVSHIVQMCFGHGLGGRIPPGFLTRLVTPFQTEVFVTDNHFAVDSDQPVPHFPSINQHPPVDCGRSAKGS
jgi:hypothetical protein